MTTRTFRSLAPLLLVAWCCIAAYGEPGAPIPIEAGASIQQALDAAPDAAVLQLAPGIYEESLIIERSLSLLGPAEGDAEIVGASSGSVVMIVGENAEVRLESLTIRGARGYHAHGVTIDGTAVAELDHVILTDNAWCGIRAVDHADVRLTDCTLAANGTSGMISEDFSRVRLERCTIIGNASHGVHTLHYSEVAIVDSLISGNWTGIWAWDATRVYVSESNVVDNIDYGAIASTAALLVLETSIVSGNGHHGLLFEESSRGILSTSRISGNGADGLYAQQDAFLEINECVFEGNARSGLRLSAGACIGGFDHKLYFAGRIEGEGNTGPGPNEVNGNGEMALCPAPPGTWPAGFLRNE